MFCTAQEQSQHHFFLAPRRCQQEDVGLGPAYQPHEETVPVHAEEAGDVHQ